MSVACEPRLLVIVAILSALCACGGGGGSSSAPNVSAPTPSASPTSQTSSSATLTAGGTAQTASFTSVGAGYSGSITIQSATSGSGSIAATLLSSLPASAPTVASTARMTAAIGGSLTPLVYITLVPTAAITFSTTPTFTFALPAGFSLSAGSSVYVGFYDPTQSTTGWQVLLGPGSVSGQTIAFAAINRTITLAADTTYTFALFSTGQVLAPVTPSPSPSPSPTATATPTSAPLALRQIGGAPEAATLAQLQSATRRSAQSGIVQGVANGLPILVESSGMVGVWSASQMTWVTDTATGADIPETSLAITPSGTLAINNTAPELACPNFASSAVCTAHPSAWEWGTSSALGKPIGMQTLTVAFGDGTTATTFDYIYDGWNLPCNAGWAYQGGVPVATTTAATSDVYADCVNANIDFPKGAMAYGTPTADKFGLTITTFPTITAQVPISNPVMVVPMTSIPQGQVYVMNTRDGGTAKVYFTAGAGIAINAANGISLHSQANGSFAF